MSRYKIGRSSQVGQSHIGKNLPCQDFTWYEESGDVVVAAVADGLGSSKHSDVASKMAAMGAVKFCLSEILKTPSPNYLAIIKQSFDEVLFSIKQQAAGDYDAFDTTLSLVIYINGSVWYGQVGDSGIVALRDDGLFECVTEAQNGEGIGKERPVFPLASVDSWVFDHYPYKAKAIFLATDGVLNKIIPPILEGQKFNLDHRYLSYLFSNVEKTSAGLSDIWVETEVSNITPNECNADDKSLIVVVCGDVLLHKQSDDYYAYPDDKLWIRLQKELDEKLYPYRQQEQNPEVKSPITPSDHIPTMNIPMPLQPQQSGNPINNGVQPNGYAHQSEQGAPISDCDFGVGYLPPKNGYNTTFQPDELGYKAVTNSTRKSGKFENSQTSQDPCVALRAEQTYKPNGTNSRKGPKRSIKNILIVIVVILLISVGIFAFFSLTKDTTKLQEDFEKSVSVSNTPIEYDGQRHGLKIELADRFKAAEILYSQAGGSYSDVCPSIVNVTESPLLVEYKVSYKGCTDITGTASVTIVPFSLANATVNNLKDTLYTGKSIIPQCDFYAGSIHLKPDVDYHYSITNNRDVGEAVISITALNKNYIGKKTVSFKILKAKPKVEINEEIGFNLNDYSYTLPKDGTATDVDGITMNGTIEWYASADRITAASTKFLPKKSGESVTLYWRFTPSSFYKDKYNIAIGVTKFTAKG
jgi:hypothetical protein